MKNIGFKRFFFFPKLGSEGKSRGATVAWRGDRQNPPQSRLPQTCLLALTLTLSPSPKLPFSSIFVSHLPSSSSHSQLHHPTFSASPSSFFSTLLPHPSHLSALVALVLFPRLFLLVPLSWSCCCCSSWFSSSSSPPPHLLVSLVLLLISHQTPFCPQVLQISLHVLLVVFSFLRFLLLS